MRSRRGGADRLEKYSTFSSGQSSAYPRARLISASRWQACRADPRSTPRDDVNVVEVRRRRLPQPLGGSDLDLLRNPAHHGCDFRNDDLAQVVIGGVRVSRTNSAAPDRRGQVGHRDFGPCFTGALPAWPVHAVPDDPPTPAGST